MKAHYKNKIFWCGSVNLLDGTIEEVHTYNEAKRNDFHHSFFFSDSACEKMKNEECAFFWIDNGIIHGEWRENIEKNIIERIKEQIIIK